MRRPANDYRFLRPQLVVWLLIVPVAMLTGCDSPPHDYTEVHRTGDIITASQWRAFLRVVKQLPGERLILPPVYAPSAQWQAQRTLSIHDLAVEEQQAIADRWDTSAMARQWDRNLAMRKAVRKEHLTLDQFAGLSLSIATAFSRTRVASSETLSGIQTQAQRVAAELLADQRPFSQLPAAERHMIATKAGCFTCLDRAERLSSVPIENQQFVLRNAAVLDQILPREFCVDPFADLVRPQEKTGMPFDEQPLSGTDANLLGNR